jgi:hypothetical protein
MTNQEFRAPLIAAVILTSLLVMFIPLDRPHPQTLDGCRTDTECETAAAELDALRERVMVLEVRQDRLTEMQRRYQVCGAPGTDQWSECMERE